MTVKHLLAAALLLGATTAKADYLFGVSWSGSWVVDPGFPTEDPPNGFANGGMTVRTPSAAGTYSYFSPANQGNTDIHFSVTIAPDATNPEVADVISYDGGFATILGGEYASTWVLNGASSEATSDLYGYVLAQTIDSPYGATGYGVSEVWFAASDVPEAPVGVLLATALGAFALMRPRVMRA